MQAFTSRLRCISTHAFMDPLSTSMTPLMVTFCIQPSLASPTGLPVAGWSGLRLLQTPMHSHSRSTDTPCSQGPQAWQQCVSVMPQPEVSLLTGWSSLKFAGKHTHTLSPTLGKIQPLAPSSWHRHPGCDPQPCSSPCAEPLTRLTQPWEGQTAHAQGSDGQTHSLDPFTFNSSLHSLFCLPPSLFLHACIPPLCLYSRRDLHTLSCSCSYPSPGVSLAYSPSCCKAQGLETRSLPTQAKQR